MYRIAHIGVVVKDADKSAAFYREALGCIPEGSYRDERVKILYLRSGAHVIELLQYSADEAGPRRAGIIDHLAFRVPDIDAAVAALRARGVTLLFDAPRTVMDGKRIFFFAGPDGERLELVQEVAS